MIGAFKGKRPNIEDHENEKSNEFAPVHDAWFFADRDVLQFAIRCTDRASCYGTSRTI
jgi:hypothetical protein